MLNHSIKHNVHFSARPTYSSTYNLLQLTGCILFLFLHYTSFYGNYVSKKINSYQFSFLQIKMATLTFSKTESKIINSTVFLRVNSQMETKRRLEMESHQDSELYTDLLVGQNTHEHIIVSFSKKKIPIMSLLQNQHLQHCHCRFTKTLHNSLPRNSSI